MHYSRRPLLVVVVVAVAHQSVVFARSCRSGPSVVYLGARARAGVLFFFLATLFSLSHTMQGLATHTLTHREEGRCRDSVWEEGRLLGRAGCHCPRQCRLTARQGHPTRQTVATTALRPSPTLSKKGWRWPSWPPGYRLPGPLNPPPWSMGGGEMSKAHYFTTWVGSWGPWTCTNCLVFRRS